MDEGDLARLGEIGGMQDAQAGRHAHHARDTVTRDRSGQASVEPRHPLAVRGKRYLVIPVGGANLPAELIALALP
jgi:hypothetical protein